MYMKTKIILIIELMLIACLVIIISFNIQPLSSGDFILKALAFVLYPYCFLVSATLFIKAYKYPKDELSVLEILMLTFNILFIILASLAFYSIFVQHSLAPHVSILTARII
jgi:hypothetical protein